MPNAPLPDIRQLMREVQAHQKALDKIRENYTYRACRPRRISTRRPGQEDGDEREFEDFFVNGHVIERR